ncbi:S1 family peptidase [Bradyrhizobium commune]|uniref:Trypsin-like peptidase domain-containing protein n=1 Tax=Bradyrhizobium commune TaxID=83627 RepID=A0A7S9DA55_9BRAD|nr:serine protease [Bradyrhizobium commune]QPF93982.1 trypsin-like peptidase domain-containing protein [Bradyrhizobium commune]
MVTIDEYSVAAIPIEMFFNETYLSLGTAFVWLEGDRYFLITNWHNVSGRDPNTGRHLSKTAAEPNRIRVWLNHKGALGNKIAKVLSLRDGENGPLWWIHPNHGNKIDVVALPLDSPPDVEMYPINHMQREDLTIQIGMDVFVLGYPFGVGPGGLPVWKRASIATEPQLSPDQQLHIFIDTASRPGMSGSPVIRRTWAVHMMENGNVSMGTGIATRFVGVYSGRIVSEDPLDANLGLMWPAAFVPEIISGARRDS